jgi:hypothetical protein
MPLGRLAVEIVTPLAEATVSVAVVLLTRPAELLTATPNPAPLSTEVVGGVVYVAEVAPLIAAPFLFH